MSDRIKHEVGSDIADEANAYAEAPVAHVLDDGTVCIEASALYKMILDLRVRGQQHDQEAAEKIYLNRVLDCTQFEEIMKGGK